MVLESGEVAPPAQVWILKIVARTKIEPRPKNNDGKSPKHIDW